MCTWELFTVQVTSDWCFWDSHINIFHTTVLFEGRKTLFQVYILCSESLNYLTFPQWK